jgi:hypothetical protein
MAPEEQRAQGYPVPFQTPIAPDNFDPEIWKEEYDDHGADSETCANDGTYDFTILQLVDSG